MSKRIAVLTILLASLTLPAFAEEKRCTGKTQDCLNSMAASLQYRGWVGVEFDNSGARYAISRVVTGSPAEKAGLRVGDVLLGVNGLRYADKAADWRRVEKAWRPGTTFKYIVDRQSKEVIVSVKLGKMPGDVRAMILGAHMMEHVKPLGQMK